MIALLLIFSLQTFAADPIIKSKDDIVFHTPDTFQFTDIGKISEFRGIIDRVYFVHHDLKMIDLYQFKTDMLKADKEICMSFAEQIFNLSSSKVYELKSFKVANSNKGKVCEIYIADKVKPKKKEDSFQRFVTVGFINTKANVLVYHPHGMTDDKTSEIRQFWNSLR